MTNVSTFYPQTSARGKLFLIVFSLAMLGVFAVVPYSLALNPLPEEVGISPTVAVALSLVQNAVLMGLATGLGLYFARKTGLGLPLVEAWLDGRSLPAGWQRRLLLALLLGVVGAAILLVLDLFLFASRVEALLAAAGTPVSEMARPTPWQGLLASFYGGISEEVLLRLGLFSFLAWLGARVDATDAALPTRRVLWVAVIVTALLFGLAHLPATAGLGLPLNGLVVSRALLLNGVVGVIAGWLYFTRGLESAIVAHFAADIVLHVFLPLLTG